MSDQPEVVSLGLGRYRVNRGSSTTVAYAVADGKVFIRGVKNLYCFGKK